MTPHRNTTDLSAPSLIAAIEERIEKEKLVLEAHLALRNDSECTQIRHKIADAKIMLLTFSGDLPL